MQTQNTRNSNLGLIFTWLVVLGPIIGFVVYLDHAIRKAQIEHKRRYEEQKERMELEFREFIEWIRRLEMDRESFGPIT